MKAIEMEKVMILYIDEMEFTFKKYTTSGWTVSSNVVNKDLYDEAALATLDLLNEEVYYE
jgi:hypothetical protein